MKNCIKRITAVLLLTACITVTSCKAALTDNTPDTTAGKQTPDTSSTAETQKPVSTAEENHEPVEYDNTTYPFWLSDTVYNECITMIKRADGTISAKTLFTPKEIIGVYDYTLQNTYTPGTDYEWVTGTSVLTRLDNSSIPYFTEADLSGLDENGKPVKGWQNTADGWSESDPWDSLGRARIGSCLFCISPFYYEKQIAITYKYDPGEREIAHSEYSASSLPKTTAKLKAGEELRIVFYGDSILEGCDASSRYNRAPNQPVLDELVRLGLKESYSSKIKLFNLALGGMTSVWGKENVSSYVVNKRPDLVILGFGMNDGTLPATDTRKNLQSIMDTVRASNPDCEFIVLDTISPNASSGFLNLQPQYPKVFAKLATEGTAFISIYTTFTDMFKYKDYSSLSGNNLNHPNDWFIRVYAMNILSVLVDYEGGSI